MRRVVPWVLAVGCGAGTGDHPDAGGRTDLPFAGDAADAPEAPAGDTGGLFVPPGFALTPWLSDQPVRTFSGAAPATEPGRDYAAVLVTDAGTIVLDLTEAETPITVNSFVFLARNRYFDGVAFHRVLEGFVAQAGDPNTLQDNRSRWGTGGPGYTFGLELVPTLRFDARGVLGMARAASPTSNGSQFFITLAPTPSLNNMYTVFGRVLDGDTVLDRIARNAGPSAPPATPTRMTQVYIVERPR